LIHSSHMPQPLQFSHFRTSIRSGVLCNSCSSWLVLILLTPCLVIGMYTFLKMLFSHVFNITLSFWIVDHVSHPYITTGFTLFVYSNSLYSAHSSRLKNMLWTIIILIACSNSHLYFITDSNYTVSRMISLWYCIPY
jgi:hypothetical protein